MIQSNFLRQAAQSFTTFPVFYLHPYNSLSFFHTSEGLEDLPCFVFSLIFALSWNAPPDLKLQVYFPTWLYMLKYISIIEDSAKVLGPL